MYEPHIWQWSTTLNRLLGRWQFRFMLNGPTSPLCMHFYDKKEKNCVLTTVHNFFLPPMSSSSVPICAMDERRYAAGRLEEPGVNATPAVSPLEKRQPGGGSGPDGWHGRLQMWDNDRSGKGNPEACHRGAVWVGIKINSNRDLYSEIYSRSSKHIDASIGSGRSEGWTNFGNCLRCNRSSTTIHLLEF